MFIVLQNSRFPLSFREFLIKATIIITLRSISVGDFNKWFEGINDQAHRDSSPLYFTIREFLSSTQFYLFLVTKSISTR